MQSTRRFSDRSGDRCDHVADHSIHRWSGAREAGVIYFIDRALSTFDADLSGAYRAGLVQVQQKREENVPRFRTHTLYGFLGNSSYGGNRDHVGWKLIGFEDRMAYQPPFGYYDGGGQDGSQ